MDENNLFWKMYSKRSVVSFFIIMFMFLSCVLRIAAISTSDYSTVYAHQNRLKMTISKQRATIFDCNMIPITNSQKKIIAAVSPTPRAITAISSILKDEKLETVLNELRLGKPVLTEIDEKIKCDGIICTEVFVHSKEDMPSVHLVGYTDKDLKGISGLELAYDDILNCDKEVYVSYECDGKGNILEGAEPELYNDLSVESGGVVSTIDINIQSIAEKTAASIEKGAVVIAEADTGKIRASVSLPYFDCTNPAEYLEDTNSPLLNRSINAYNVGSVFKPCVAIAGIENEKTDFCYNCRGSSKILDRNFKCHKAEGHKFMNLKSAIANSCNTYFYNFAFEIGEDNIYNTATTLRFGRSIKICKGISTSAGNLPKIANLSNPAHLANFSIGQGELLLSPVSMLTLYSAIANDGCYYLPSVVEGTVKNGSFEEYDKGKPTRVMKSSTAKILKEYLNSVLTEGTGKTAKPKLISAAGKTATAQTGKYENGVEICQGWFCGFFPLESPKYVVTVFSENTQKQTKSCGEVFSIIADEIAKKENL